MALHFFIEDIDKFRLERRVLSSWIKKCIINYGKKAGNINYIFCSDEYLKNINVQYLKHDYFTDIITFNYTEKTTLHADIYISIDRVTDNAIEFKNEFNQELKRVMIHGILHLIGFNDHSSSEKLEMRKAEDECLSLF